MRLFAGSYASILLGGSHSFFYPFNNYSLQAPVLVAEDYGRDSVRLLNTAYSKRFDAGLQGGIEYRWDNTLLQIGYTLGLVDVAATRYQAYVDPVHNPARTRSWQATVTYLLCPAR